MKALFLVVVLILSLTALGIGIYLQCLILTKIKADSLMWFLFWFNVPLTIIVQILSKVLDKFTE